MGRIKDNREKIILLFRLQTLCRQIVPYLYFILSTFSNTVLLRFRSGDKRKVFKVVKRNEAFKKFPLSYMCTLFVFKVILA